MATMELDLPAAYRELDLTTRYPAAMEDDEFVPVGPEFEQFANALDDAMSPLLSTTEKRDRLLDLPRKYHENALKRLVKLRDARARLDDFDMDTDEIEDPEPSPEQLEEINEVEKEVQTWDLLRRILPLRHLSSLTQAQIPRLQNLQDSSSPKDNLDYFLNTNSIAKERRAVLQWLQSNASSGPDIDNLTRDLQQNADRGDIIAHGWLHTRSSIKLKKRITGWPHLLDRQSLTISKSHTTSSGTPMVTQLDPDAPLRQGKALQPQDEYFERAIWVGCFEHLRRGSGLEKIREWCAERTELWRAVSVSGMLLSEGDKAGDTFAETDPASLALWRRMCFGLARQGGSDDYERAVYGVLSGDIPSVEKVASTWDDHLFVHYNALLRTQIDQFLMEQCPPGIASSLTTSFPSFDAIQYHGDSEDIEKRLLRSLQSKLAIGCEGFEPNKALQAAIIAREVGEYLSEQGAALAAPSQSMALVPSKKLDAQSLKYFNLDDHRGLRIVAHVYVLVTMLERLDVEENLLSAQIPRTTDQWAQDNILSYYTDLLRRAGLQAMIPLYCSILDPSRMNEVLSDSMILIKYEDKQRELEERRWSLKLMEKANINVLTFVKDQAMLLYDNLAIETGEAFEAKDSFRILEDPKAGVGKHIKADFISGDDEDRIDPRHDRLISALEWLLLVDQTWPNVFAVGTEIYKYFLRHMHLNAARQVMERVPFSEVMRDLSSRAGANYEEQLDNVEFWVARVREREVNADPQRVMLDAFNFKHLEALVRALDSLETIASHYEISCVDSPPRGNPFWVEFEVSVQAAKDAMEPLLKNWLVRGIQQGDEVLRDLRAAYLPETILAYISALHMAGCNIDEVNFLECMQLAAVITEQNSDLESLFVEAKRVGELLEALAASSKAMAISKGEKKGKVMGMGKRKIKERGWSGDLWSVKS